MFGKRSDGKKIKTIDPFFKVIPHIMFERHDASNAMNLKVNCETLDAYIAKKRKENISINYMHIVIASIVRIFALKPQLNRFVMNGRLYKRNKIYVSFSVKKRLKEEAEESTIKLEFEGTENIFEIKEKVDESIRTVCLQQEDNSTDKTAKIFSFLPNFLLKYSVRFCKFLDRHGLLPKSIIKASPFHTSCFLTNLKSIHMNYIYHHLYNFGTTGMFVSMGKEAMEPIVNDEGEIVPAKIMNMGIVADERLCDGFYHANSLRLFKKIVENPEVLEEKLEKINQDID
jgi:hypothetical protein